MKKAQAVLIALILALGASSSAYAASYSYTSIDYPGASGTRAYGINDAGTVVGYYADASGVWHGFSLSGGSYTSLDYPGAQFTEVHGINNAGTIVGQYVDASAVKHGFSLSGTTHASIDYPGATLTDVYGINNAGTIVGVYVDASGVQHGFVLSSGAYTTLDYPGALMTNAYGINDGGTIVGYYQDASAAFHGFSLSGGTYTTFDYPGAYMTLAYGINNAGTIVGSGFVLSGTTYTPLTYPAAFGTSAYGINNGGMIVGEHDDASGVFHGFLASPGPVPPSLIVVNSGTNFGLGADGVVTSIPSGINCGQNGIACSASYSIGTSVTLTVTPNSDSTFTGWSGACQNASGTCVVTMNAPETVTAHYIITGIPTFSDVSSTSIYENYIEAIYNNGITTGCGNNDYCPSEQVTRDQMAAFLVRGTQVAEGQSTVNFTCNGGVTGASVSCATTTPYFSDVPATDGFFPYVQKLYELGITTGCGNNNYCPSEDVTRDQMAAFLVRATQVAAGQSTVNFTCNGGVAGASVNCATTTPYFNDVPTTDSFFPYVQKLKELGITTGCGNGNYCPSEDVTRDQMAAFLARAFLAMH
jgi:probable HAF family extracellular repeat protein